MGRFTLTTAQQTLLQRKTRIMIPLAREKLLKTTTTINTNIITTTTTRSFFKLMLFSVTGLVHQYYQLQQEMYCGNPSVTRLMVLLVHQEHLVLLHTFIFTALTVLPHRALTLTLMLDNLVKHCREKSVALGS